VNKCESGLTIIAKKSLQAIAYVNAPRVRQCTFSLVDY